MVVAELFGRHATSIGVCVGIGIRISARVDVRFNSDICVGVCIRVRISISVGIGVSARRRLTGRTRSATGIVAVEQTVAVVVHVIVALSGLVALVVVGNDVGVCISVRVGVGVRFGSDIRIGVGIPVVHRIAGRIVGRDLDAGVVDVADVHRARVAVGAVRARFALAAQIDERVVATDREQNHGQNHQRILHLFLSFLPCCKELCLGHAKHRGRETSFSESVTFLGGDLGKGRNSL
ncbi:hypothetical protein HZB93_00810 [Candidatus Falkowbacteria bacterium]|nr:hypothetical protein [Candidatus Falkowbacteria bacterium]